MPRRPILLAVAVALLTTVAIIAVVTLTRPDPGAPSPQIARGEVVPDISGTTLDGAAMSLTELRGRPVIVNFWGPSCVPCRDEFPLFLDKTAAHEEDGLVILGVLMDDPPEPARDFVDEFGATWPTVIDEDGAARTAYRVVGRPTSFFVDGEGILRSIQIGEVREADFDRQYAQIAP
jgi:peroxiredoxin